MSERHTYSAAWKYNPELCKWKSVATTTLIIFEVSTKFLGVDSSLLHSVQFLLSTHY